LDEPQWWYWLPAGVFVLLNDYVGTALWGQTVGKRLLGIRVVLAECLEAPGWLWATIRRYGLMPFCWLPLSGPAMEVADDATMFFNRRRQALHDIISGTIVVEDGSWRRWKAQHPSRSE
jgi:uncharacterized RDD family membrane protein YckC